MRPKHFIFALTASVLLGIALSDKADDKLAACCESEGVDVDCCKYRQRSVRRSDNAGVLDNNRPVPVVRSIWRQKSVATPVDCFTDEGFPTFFYCATGGLDNTGCCKGYNVTTPLRLELCDGTNPISHNNLIDYATCASVRWKIVKCNHDANDY